MRRSLALVGLTTVGALGLVGACSTSTPSNPSDAGTSDATGDSNGASFSLEVPCTDTVDAIYADPGPVAALAKGAIIKCFKDADIAKADLQATAQAHTAPDEGYTGKDFTSGAHVYRVLYRTERGDAAGTAGYSSAIVYVPDTPRAASLPVVVASHGSRGQAAKCAPSKNDPAASDVEPDFIHQVYPLVGSGYAVIAPDLAGYANYGKNPPSAYANAADVGKSTLDGARALRAMFSKSVNANVILVGHSQGGGTALAALALSNNYGAGGTISGVSLYAPLWLPARAYAAILQAPSSYPILKSAAPKVSIWYHYTVSELLDGPGHGVDLFQASKQAAIKSFVDNDCWAEHYPDLEAIATSANDVFDPAYASSIKAVAAGLGGGQCNGDALCQKWMDRFNAERPHITGAAAQVPILLSWGGKDTTMSPDLMKCVFDRLIDQEHTNIKVCYVPGETHGGIVATQADHVNDWIAARGIPGATEPAACALDQTAATDDGGNLFTCNPLVVNDQD